MNRLLVVVAALVAVSFASAAASNAAPAQKLPPGMTPAMFKQIMAPGPSHPTGIPAGAVPYLGCIPTMGFHYANPKDWPFGPIYGWYKGKVTFTEIMVAKSAFENGTSWSNVLKPLPGHQVDHVDFWYEAHGHPGRGPPWLNSRPRLRSPALRHPRLVRAKLRVHVLLQQHVRQKTRLAVI